jgi:hypothetical protein
VKLFDLLLMLLASPILALRGILTLCHNFEYWLTAYRTKISCPNCGTSISLLGLWKCGCGYTYRGHVLRSCPVCHLMPAMVRCTGCGVTAKLPEP